MTAVIIVNSVPRASPAIGYENLLESATITTSSAETDYPASNAYNWLPYDHWKPGVTGMSYIYADCGSAKSCDYFAIFGHDLGAQGSTLQLSYSTVGLSGPWTSLGSGFAPAGTEAMFEKFTSVSARYYRVIFNNPTAIASVGVVTFGSRIDMPRGVMSGFAPPLWDDFEVRTNLSQTGRLLGYSQYRTPFDLSADFHIVPADWIRSTWKPFINSRRPIGSARSELKPFFFSWDADAFSGEAAFCWFENTPPRPNYVGGRFLNLSLRCKALIS